MSDILERLKGAVVKRSEINPLSYVVEIEADEFNELIHELSAARDELEQMTELLKASNKRLRSMFEVIKRRGKKTNWEGAEKVVKRELERQHKVLHPHDPFDDLIASGGLPEAQSLQTKDTGTTTEND